MLESDESFDPEPIPVEPIAVTEDPDPATGSLMDDLSTLYSDGKNYVEAELRYQKTRASFVADRVKTVGIYLAGAIAVLHLLLIGLVIGLILSLATLIGPLAATLAVTVTLGIIMAALLVLARGKFKNMTNALKEDGNVG